MNFRRFCFVVASSLLLFGALGCAPHYVAVVPPPPPGEMPPLIALADRNGFDTGRADGARDVESGRRPEPRRTRAYHDTPGYDPHLGPFEPYQNAFRNAYLRGYDRGFRRG